VNGGEKIRTGDGRREIARGMYGPVNPRWEYSTARPELPARCCRRTGPRVRSAVTFCYGLP